MPGSVYGWKWKSTRDWIAARQPLRGDITPITLPDPTRGCHPQADLGLVVRASHPLHPGAGPDRPPTSWSAVSTVVVEESRVVRGDPELLDP
jgi:hypothetical protein